MPQNNVCEWFNDGLWIKMAILNVKSVDYRCGLWGVIKNDAINMLSNYKFWENNW